MDAKTATRPDPVETTVTRSSLADIATELEAATFHLKSMLDLTWEKLDDIGGEGYSVDQAQADSGMAQSLIHAAKKYLSEVMAAKDRLYDQAWALPMADEAE